MEDKTNAVPAGMALQGIRVLDMSRVLAGPWCTQTLADLGAEIWKIESPVNGDDTRSWMPPEVDGESTYFMCANRSKQSLAINLKTPEGQALVRRLAEQADVLVENYRLGTLERFGLGYEDLAEVNPRLVYCSISGYGRTGPRASEPGYDFIIQAESGLMAITGAEEGEPMKLGVAITDLVTGMNGVQAILAALFSRERTGRGQHIDLALLDGATCILANIGSGYLAAGDEPQRFGNAHPTVVPYQIMSSSDGKFALAVGNDRQFSALCQAMGRPDLARDERYRLNRDRVLNRDTLIPELQRVFSGQSVDYWLECVRAAGVPCGSVRTVPQAMDAPEIEARGLIVNVVDERHGTLRLTASPLKLRGTPPRKPVAPPRLGEHTDNILRGVLACTPAELEQWRAAGIIA